MQEIASKLAAALQLGENLVWKDTAQTEAKPGPSNENIPAKQATNDPAQVKEPEPERQGLEPTPTPSLSRCVTATYVDTDIAPTPDIPETPVPSFPPGREDVPETPLPNLPPESEEPERPPPTPTFHPPPGEPMLQKRSGIDMATLPTPFGKSGPPPLPFKLGGGKLPPVGAQGTSLDNLPNPPDDELPSYEEVEMADKLSGRKPKKAKQPKAELEPL